MCLSCCSLQLQYYYYSTPLTYVHCVPWPMLDDQMSEKRDVRELSVSSPGTDVSVHRFVVTCHWLILSLAKLSPASIMLILMENNSVLIGHETCICGDLCRVLVLAYLETERLCGYGDHNCPFIGCNYYSFNLHWLFCSSGHRITRIFMIDAHSTQKWAIICERTQYRLFAGLKQESKNMKLKCNFGGTCPGMKRTEMGIWKLLFEGNFQNL